MWSTLSEASEKSTYEMLSFLYALVSLSSKGSHFDGREIMLGAI